MVTEKQKEYKKMRYLQISYDNTNFWMEIEEDDYVVRQVIKDVNGSYHISCMEDCLAEGTIQEQDLDGTIEKITKNQFEMIWEHVKSDYSPIWEKKKRNTPIGSYVKATYRYDYPQGYIFSIGDWPGVLVINDTIAEQMVSVQVGDIITGKVTGYDDLNMWFVISLIS